MAKKNYWVILDLVKIIFKINSLKEKQLKLTTNQYEPATTKCGYGYD